MNRKNIDPNKADALINVVSKKLGISSDKLKNELESGKFDSTLAAMNKNDAAKFQQALNNPKMIEKMMSTPQAAALYKKLNGEK